MHKLALAITATGTLALSLFNPTAAEAVMINGNLTIEGGAVFSAGNLLGEAKSVDTFSNVQVRSRDGDFSSLAVNQSVTVLGGDSNADFVFDPSTPYASLFDVGGFNFSLTGSTVVLRTASFLLVEGNGYFSGNGFDSTPGVFRFTSQSPAAGGVFSFSAATGTVNGVPDGGTTAALLGLSLIGLTVVHRKTGAFAAKA